MPRRILVVTRHPAADQRVLEREVRSLATTGAEIEVHALGRYNGSVPATVRMHDLGSSPRSVADRLRLLLRAARVVATTQAEVVHVHDPDFLLVALIARLRRRRAVYDVHEYFGLVAASRFADRPQVANLAKRVVDSLELRLARAVGNVSVVAPDMAARFERAGCRVAITPNHVSARDFAPAQRADDPHRASTVVSVGTLDPDRGSLLLVDVARAVRRKRRSARFRIVRRFFNPDHERQVLEKLGGDMESIEWIDPMPSTDVAAFLRTGAIGISLMLPVGQHPMTAPTKLFEYMSQGLAVVASDLPGTRGIVEPSGCGVLVDPHDVDGYATAIVRLIDNPDEAVAMGRRGQQAVARSLTWEVNGERALLALYDRLR